MSTVTEAPVARRQTRRMPNVDVAGLEHALRKQLRGEVRFTDGDRALYATDSSNYRQIPIGVVVPRDTADAVAAVEICQRFGAPLTSRGGGTSLAGQCCNTAVILDFSKYVHRLLEIDTEKQIARVEPGIVLDDLNHAAEKHSLIFGPDPATHSHCCLGGMIGNNSGGVHSVMAQFHGGGPRTSDNVEELEILTYDGVRMRVGKTSDAELEQIIREGGRRGDIYRRLRDLRDRYADLIRARYPDVPRRASGYNLDELLPEKGFNVARALAGSEGTCVVILNAALHLIPSPKVRSLAVIAYPDVYHAGDDVPLVLKHKPLGLEGIDDVLIDAMLQKGIHPRDLKLLPEGKGWLIVEFGGETKQEADDRARALLQEIKQQSKSARGTKIFDDPREELEIWEIRDSGLGASARVPDQPDTWEGWEDTAVPPEKIGAYLRDFRKLLEKYGYKCTLYGHFGQGIVHTRIDFGLKTAEGIQQYMAFTKEGAELVVRYGGTLSGEHGDGQARGDLLEIMFGPELVEAFREFKSIWDPEWKMNPGKIVEPYHRNENLRYGEEYDPSQPPTHFQFPRDHGSFSFALERCVGVGQCRREEHGTMCPSYMVTREEKHCTRGRARLLWELLQGDIIGRNGWRDKSVHEALNLCLACKGCKSDCPVHVDMATYKAEFLSHYYEGHIRPMPAYAMGLIYWWARLASLLPGVVNFFTHTEPFAGLMKRLGGIAPQRKIPKFAKETFRDWFARRPTANQGKPRVILWPDTFNNFFFPETAKAAVEVLEGAGFQVTIPPRILCCGRPLYDWGMLELAKRQLGQILDVLSADISAGTPIVGLEPSCVAVFRDELKGLFSNSEQADRLRQQTYTLSEFLVKHAPDYQAPKLQRQAIMHGHCHHKAIMQLGCEETLLEKMGIDLKVLDSGCCGMAGAFGYEAEKYDVSVACGERVLLPEVRSAPKDTLIIADGFSCREQIEQLTDRRALHSAQVLQMALREGPQGPYGNLPEKRYPGQHEARVPRFFPIALAVVGALGIGMLATRARRTRRW
ncbi:FAD-binding and (Fe-S)-binding domain-containing protein [Verrucomicrobiota bacterium sgz303538]